MLLLTWHATLVCLNDDGRTLSHIPLAEQDRAWSTGLARAPETELTIKHASLGVLTFTPASGGLIALSRFGRFLGPDPDGTRMAFDRDGCTVQDALLPITSDGVRLLRHILSRRWIAAATRRVLPREGVALEPGFVLVADGLRVDLADFLAAPQPTAEPQEIAFRTPAGVRRLVSVQPRSSAILTTDLWPVRARRQAEMMVLAAHRFVLRCEPSSAELDEAATRMVAREGAASLFDLLEELAARKPGSAPGRLEAAEALAVTGQAELALAELKTMAAERPGDSETLFALGRLLHAEGRIAEAGAALQACLAAEAGHRGALGLWADMLSGLGRRVAAAGIYETALNHHPGWQDAIGHLAKCYADLKWRDRAEAVLAMLPATASGWHDAARRENAAALARLRAIPVPQNPDWNQAARYAETLLQLGRLEECRALIDRMAAAAPGRLAPEETRTRLLAREQGIDAAITHARALSVRFGPVPRFKLFFVEWLLEAGALAEARDLLEGLAELRSDAQALLARIAVWQDDAAALTAAAQAWLEAEPGATQACIFALAAARRAGHTRRLAGLEARPSPPTAMIQFWHDPQIPDDVAAAMRSWQRLCPGLRHQIFDDSAARAFIEQRGPAAVLPHYDAARHPAMRSDLFRLAYLAEHGGIYVDADESCQHDMRPVFAALSTVELILWLSPNTPPYLFNGFIGASPASPLLREALAETLRLLDEAASRNTPAAIWQTTGPGLLTRVAGRNAATPGRLLLLTDREFRRFSKTEERLAYKHAAGGNWRGL